MRFIILVLVIVSLASCRFGGGKKISGNGNITSQQKEAGEFTAVDVSGQIVLKISQGATPSVRIETDENIHEYLEVQTKGNTLVIKTRNGYNLEPTRSVTAYVTTAVFRELEASGQCAITGETAITGSEPLSIESSGQVAVQLELNVPKLTTSISGQGSLSLKGRAQEFSAGVSGNGTLKCFELNTDNTDLDLSGASSVEITVNNKLDVDASGASNVFYKGNASVNKSTSGASKVTKVQ